MSGCTHHGMRQNPCNGRCRTTRWPWSSWRRQGKKGRSLIAVSSIERFSCRGMRSAAEGARSGLRDVSHIQSCRPIVASWRDQPHAIPVCTENPIRVDDLTESPKTGGMIRLLCFGRLASPFKSKLPLEAENAVLRRWFCR